MLSKFLNPKNDIAFKKIFGSEKNKDILIHFINDILGLSGNEQVIEVEFLPTVQEPEIASKKQSILDVLCKDGAGVQYIIEMQVDPLQGFEKRAQYYAAKAYCRQTDRGKKESGMYKNLKKIVFIAIADCLLFPNKRGYKSRHYITDEETRENDLKDFSFTFIELTKFPKKKGDKLDNIVEKWCYFFKYAEDTSEEELKEIIGNDAIIGRAYEALNQFNWSEEELVAYEQEVKREWDNRAIINTAIEAAEEKGKKKGKVEGRAEGRAEGKLQKAREMARKMLAKGKEIEEIMEFTELSKEEIENIRDNKEKREE